MRELFNSEAAITGHPYVKTNQDNREKRTYHGL